MSLLQQALHAGRRVSRPASARRSVLVAGAAGALGAAVLEQALVAFGRVQVLVDAPVAAAIRGFEPVPRTALDAAADVLHADTALVVFDRERGLHGREVAFHRPAPQGLPILARALLRHGVRHLVVVLPHAPSLMPAAFKVGLASLDEQAVAALGFEQLVIVRSARAAVRRRAASWPQRVADAMLAQLHWMVPRHDQPVRPVKVASFVVALASELPHARSGARVAPPELVWQAAQLRDPVHMVRRWLDEGQWPQAPVAAGRW